MLPVVPLRYMLAILIIMSITYSASSYVYIVGSAESETTYDYSYEENEYYDFIPDDENLSDADIGWLEQINNFFTTLWDGMVTLFKIATFQLPDMPLVVTGVLNLIMIPMGVVFTIGLIPYIAKLMELLIKLIDAIIPF